MTDEHCDLKIRSRSHISVGTVMVRSSTPQTLSFGRDSSHILAHPPPPKKKKKKKNRKKIQMPVLGESQLQKVNPVNGQPLFQGSTKGTVSLGGDNFLASENLGRMFDRSFPTCAFSFFFASCFLFKV